MSKEQPAALRLADELLEPVPDYPEPTSLEMAAATELRNLHTENTALRVTEDNLRQELQECQAQRRAAFRRIEELEALRAQIGQGVPIYQLQLASGAWIDQSEQSYRYNLKNGSDRLRIVYTHPAPQQKPLTDEQIDRLLPEIVNGGFTVITYGRAVARAIEAAHNIGEKK